MVIKVSQGGSGSGVLNSGLMAELGTPPSGTPLCLWSPRKTRRPQGAQFESHTQKLCTQAGGGHWVWALLTPVSGLQPSTNISHVVFSNQLWKFVELQPLSLCFFFSFWLSNSLTFTLCAVGKTVCYTITLLQIHSNFSKFTNIMFMRHTMHGQLHQHIYFIAAESLLVRFWVNLFNKFVLRKESERLRSY